MIALTVTTGAVAAPTAGADNTSSAKAELEHSRHVVEFFQNRGWMRAPRQPNCSTVPWTRTCRIARHVYQREHEQLERLQRLVWRILPHTQDWATAVRIAQRPYPGTNAWLMSCSAAEGGHGQWKPNNQGSGVGGWMQMYPSTFWGMYHHAEADLRARGFKLPASAASWYSPLGQALAAGWARSTGNDAHHWSASFGNGC